MKRPKMRYWLIEHLDITIWFTTLYIWWRLFVRMHEAFWWFVILLCGRRESRLKKESILLSYDISYDIHSLTRANCTWRKKIHCFVGVFSSWVLLLFVTFQICPFDACLIRQMNMPSHDLYLSILDEKQVWCNLKKSIMNFIVEPSRPTEIRCLWAKEFSIYSRAQ